ncbi:MAG TPA: sigma-E factor negative regulatory protein [Methylophilus sp.]|uniref:sigma-E factor negative regulatory protein n=1 Tax=Methylophilus sp. TaxID=29541 RepID=UPI002C651381|nr:sigma-E factor negative regulatory protein [Methylophilus sp.]HSH87872.1 sigma-E factor negative regulatory protein [Methylophilus sp.]
MKQQLSALIDGEADIERCEHIFLAAKSTGEVAQAWQDYHVIRDVMREENWVQPDITSRIMAALSDEPVVLAPRAVPQPVVEIKPRPSKYIWSIAASVAAAFFVGMFVLNQPTAVESVQIADSETDQYVMAHHNYSPNSATYYIHNVTYAGE